MRAFGDEDGEVKRTMYRCPGGSVRGGGTCINVNECVDNPCLNGGTCVDREPARRYDCVCAFGYTGHDCELELLASGIITPSRDFIIAIIVCLFMLLGEHYITFFYLHVINASMVVLFMRHHFKKFCCCNQDKLHLKILQFSLLITS